MSPVHWVEIASGEEIADLPIHQGGMGKTDGVHSRLVQAVFRTGGADGGEAFGAGGVKMSAVDDQFLHIELSRVRNLEKTELKTAASNRRIDSRSTMKKVLGVQKSQTASFQGPYVFFNTQGRPVNQVTLREVWVTAMKKSGLAFRRMYETRHAFASWALAAGESPEWVARTMGHVNTAMIYKTYGRYIPNLTIQDGSALEGMLVKAANKRQPE